MPAMSVPAPVVDLEKQIKNLFRSISGKQLDRSTCNWVIGEIRKKAELLPEGRKRTVLNNLEGLEKKLDKKQK